MKLFTNFAVTYVPEIEKQGHYLEGIYIKSSREIGEVEEKTVSSFLSSLLFSLCLNTTTSMYTWVILKRGEWR